MTTTKKTPTKQNKREAKAAEKAKAKKQPVSKSTSKGKFNCSSTGHELGPFSVISVIDMLVWSPMSSCSPISL